jgi:hypothetical protein
VDIISAVTDVEQYISIDINTFWARINWRGDAKKGQRDEYHGLFLRDFQVTPVTLSPAHRAPAARYYFLRVSTMVANPKRQPALNLKGAFQATVRSATSTLPLVSGLNSTATRKMAKADLGEPTTLEAELRVIFATLGFVA